MGRSLPASHARRSRKRARDCPMQLVNETASSSLGMVALRRSVSAARQDARRRDAPAVAKIDRHGVAGTAESNVRGNPGDPQSVHRRRSISAAEIAAPTRSSAHSPARCTRSFADQPGGHVGTSGCGVDADRRVRDRRHARRDDLRDRRASSSVSGPRSHSARTQARSLATSVALIGNTVRGCRRGRSRSIAARSRSSEAGRLAIAEPVAA